MSDRRSHHFRAACYLCGKMDGVIDRTTLHTARATVPGDLVRERPRIHVGPPMDTPHLYEPTQQCATCGGQQGDAVHG